MDSSSSSSSLTPEEKKVAVGNSRKEQLMNGDKSLVDFGESTSKSSSDADAVTGFDQSHTPLSPDFRDPSSGVHQAKGLRTFTSYIDKQRSWLARLTRLSSQVKSHRLRLLPRAALTLLVPTSRLVTLACLKTRRWWNYPCMT